MVTIGRKGRGEERREGGGETRSLVEWGAIGTSVVPKTKHRGWEGTGTSLVHFFQVKEAECALAFGL